LLKRKLVEGRLSGLRIVDGVHSLSHKKFVDDTFFLERNALGGYRDKGDFKIKNQFKIDNT
ncbi:hypothetical protein KI387_038810, partial [Taxus chinensis]